MKLFLFIAVLLLFLGCDSNWKETVITEVSKMEEEYAETQRTGDFEKQASLHSEEYSYIDISGKKVTKDEVDFRRNDDLMTSVGLVTSEQEVIPLSPELAISRGKQEGLSIYYGGIPRVEPTRYMAVWRKENGAWKLLADQVTPIIDRELKRPIIANPPNLDQLEGQYKLFTTPSVTIQLTVVDDTLKLSIPEKLKKGLAFLPTYGNTFFSRDRPWELKFLAKDSIILNSWGQISQGIRIDEN